MEKPIKEIIEGLEKLEGNWKKIDAEIEKQKELFNQLIEILGGQNGKNERTLH